MLNTIAGGGTFLTFPALVFTGAKRERGTSTAAEPSKHSIAAPMAVSN